MKFLSLFLIIICLKHIFAVTSDCSQAYTSRMLSAHNQYRALHGAPDLVNDPNIINTAQNYANFLSSTNSFKHSNSKGLGENLAMFSSSNLGTCDAIADKFVKMWYDEVKFYNYNSPGFSMQTGHFTQVVWKGTKSLGCGLAISGNKAVGVCNYSPPGNVMGSFPSNVLPSGSPPPVNPNPGPSTTFPNVDTTKPVTCTCPPVQSTTTRATNGWNNNNNNWNNNWNSNNWKRNYLKRLKSSLSNERYDNLFD